MKLSTGIGGLDNMLNGGLQPNRTILLSGPSGAGKTTLACHFLTAQQIPSLYLTLEEPKHKIIQDMQSVGIDLHNAKHITFLGGPLAKITTTMKKVDASPLHLLDEVHRIVIEKKIQRVVIDSINLLMMIPKNPEDRREILAQLSNVLCANGCTTMFLSEMRNEYISEYGIEEFIADGVIVLEHLKQGVKAIPAISVRKMRGSYHDRELRPYKITNNGLIVFDEDTIFI